MNPSGADESTAEEGPPGPYRKALLIAAGLNLGMVFVELAAAFYANSIALFADAVDFYEDAMTYFMAAALIGFGARARAGFGGALSLMMTVPCLWIAWKAVEQLLHGLPPDPLPMGAVALLALVVNVYCAILLAPHRQGDSAHQGVWLSTRNDAIANIAVVVAAVATYAWQATWPDVAVGLVIVAINLQAAFLIARLAWMDWRNRDA